MDAESCANVWSIHKLFEACVFLLLGSLHDQAIPARIAPGLFVPVAPPRPPPPRRVWPRGGSGGKKLQTGVDEIRVGGGATRPEPVALRCDAEGTVGEVVWPCQQVLQLAHGVPFLEGLPSHDPPPFRGLRIRQVRAMSQPTLLDHASVDFLL